MPSRRQTLAEARLKGDQAERDHLRRYGAGSTAAELAEGDLVGQTAPQWADKPTHEAFKRIVEVAPWLRQVDYDLVAVLAEAIARFARAVRAERAKRHVRRTTLKSTKPKPPTQWELTREVRAAGADILRHATALGLTPMQRARLTVPAPPAPPEPEDSTWSKLLRFPTVEGGKGKAGKDKTAPTPPGKRRAP
jgi:phage terminase small subunit